MNKILITLICVLCIILPFAGLATAEEQEDQSPFVVLRDKAVDMFKPQSGTIKAILGKTLVSDITSSNGLKPRMRLDIYRRGATFIHPVTKAPMGFSEKFVGRAETVSVDAKEARMKLVNGDALTGDIVRISEANVAVLYNPDPTVSWSIAEEYYLKLRESGRFDISEIPSNTIKTAEGIIAKAREVGANAIITLSAETKEGNTILTQNIVWTEDGSTLDSSAITVTASFAGSLALGETLFAPKEQLPVYNYSLPNTYRTLTSGDFDGDGSKELALSLEREINFFTLGIELTPTLDNAVIKMPGKGLNIRLFASDLDNDKKDELIVSAMGTDTASSYIFKFDGKEFKRLWNGPIFLNLIEGVLYGQAFSKNKGYNGEIFPVLWNKEDDYKGAPALNVPSGATLYSFYPITTGGTRMYFTYGAGGFLSLLDQNGLSVWKSVEFYSTTEAPKEQEAPPMAYVQFEPPVMERMTVLGDSVLAVKKKPVVSQLKSLGNYSSQLMRIFPAGLNVTEGVLIKDIPGTVLDHIMVDGNIIILTSTWTIKPENILRLRTIFDVKLILYKLKG